MFSVFCFLQKADGLYLPSQVTFRHANDYVTYAWVEDDEISSNEDSKQVITSLSNVVTFRGVFKGLFVPYPLFQDFLLFLSSQTYEVTI